MPDDAASLTYADQRFSIDFGKIFKTEDFCQTDCFISAQSIESKGIIGTILKHSDLAVIASRRVLPQIGKLLNLSPLALNR